MSACVHCGQAPAYGHGRCRACYHYWWRTGRDRGPHLLDPTRPRRCQVCGWPAAVRRGRWCAACYHRDLRRRKKELVG
jgi:hypothetical protein